MLSASSTSTPTAQANDWDTAPPPTGDQAYVSPLIDLNQDWDSDVEALYDSPTDQELVSYDDVLDDPSGSADSESIRSEDQSFREQFVQSDLT